MQPEFKISALIDALDGPYRIPDRFRAIGVEPPPTSTILGWRRRNSCPGQWAFALLDLARQDPDMPPLDELLDFMGAD